MVNFEIFLLGMLITSTLTSLVTEAVKKILTEHNKTFPSNTLVGLISLILSAAIGTGYIIVTGTNFTATIAVYLVVLIFASWLCAMVGYDKVIQAIGQFNTNNKES